MKVFALRLCLMLLTFSEWHVQSQTNTTNSVLHKRRSLQFDGMFIGDNYEFYNQNPRGKAKKGQRAINPARQRASNLRRAVADILAGLDQYNQWWTGHEDSMSPSDIRFKRADWAEPHNPNTKTVIFTSSVARGTDSSTCSSPNDLRLFLGSARRAGFTGDIVIAVEKITEGNIQSEVKSILQQHKAVVYEVPSEICSRYVKDLETVDNFCGSEEERVPASIFRYFFYEKWAAIYNESSSILMADFKDVIFQSNPFVFHNDQWGIDYQLVLTQEFHPNMVLNRSPQHMELFKDCYGDELFERHGHKTVISSGTVLGTRNAILLWCHSLTMQLQEAIGRADEKRCTKPGIDTAFANFLGYTQKLRNALRIKMYPQGEGPINSLGGMRTPRKNVNKMGVFGPLKSFWKLLDDDNYVINWSKERSPVVHQINHFHSELMELAVAQDVSLDRNNNDSAWQALSATKCLFGCVTAA